MTGAVLSFTIVVCTAWAPPDCFADQSSFDTPLYSPLEVIAQGHVANLGTVPLRDFIRGGFVFPSQAASRLHLDSEKESSRNMRREPGMVAFDETTGMAGSTDPVSARPLRSDNSWRKFGVSTLGFCGRSQAITIAIFPANNPSIRNE